MALLLISKWKLNFALARRDYYAYCFLRKNKIIFVGIVYIINYKINENGIRFILFFSEKLYLSPVSCSFALTFFQILLKLLVQNYS